MGSETKKHPAGYWICPKHIRWVSQRHANKRWTGHLVQHLRWWPILGLQPRSIVACWIMLLACSNKSTANVDWRQSFRCSRTSQTWHVSHRWLTLIYIVLILILYSLRVSLADSESVRVHHWKLHRPSGRGLHLLGTLPLSLMSPPIVIGGPLRSIR